MTDPNSRIGFFGLSSAKRNNSEAGTDIAGKTVCGLGSGLTELALQPSQLSANVTIR